MWLEHSIGPQSANWDADNDRWIVGQKKIYRWCTNDQVPVSDWFKDFGKALEWIVDYEREKENERTNG